MRFSDPLIPGRLIKRYKRFLADIELAGGEVVTAHCANPGSMTGTDAPGSDVWLSPARNPKRKLAYTWELIRADSGALVGINTQIPNKIAEEAINDGRIVELAGYRTLRREVGYGKNSRIDFLLESPGRPTCLVEVKSVTLRRGDDCQFPDSVTARGRKHLLELAGQARSGRRAVMLYLVQRGDCGAFSIAGDIDPAYQDALGKAIESGVEAYCYRCPPSLEGIEVEAPLPLKI